MQSIDAFVVIPCLVLALAIAIGVWRGRRHGTARGVKAAAITAVIGIVGLLGGCAALTAFYYQTGGH
jgi:hypothetical protein